MARIKGPNWQDRKDLEDANNIPWNHMQRATKRCYIRIDGQFKAIGWLLQYGPVDHDAKRTWYFLAD